MRASLLVTATLLALQIGALAQTSPRTRDEILEYSLTAPGSPYIFGGSNWDPAQRTWGGCDCSGLVGKAWAINDWVPYRRTYHPYATIHLIGTPGAHWTEVPLNDVVSADALVYRYSDNSGGHTYIYEAGDAWGSHRSIEAAGSSIGIVHRWRNPPSSYSRYKGIRRKSLIENVGTSDLIVESDDGAPDFTFQGTASTSGYDSHAHYLREGDCTYTWVNAGSNDSATFQPTIPTGGFYEIFVSCNQASPNVSNARVHVHHAGGVDTVVWDQSRDGVNEWHALPGRYLLRAGRVDRVVWDNALAQPRDGSHIFRADATRFRLSNDVVVDGVGGSPGHFATLTSALQWLAAHPSLDPDRIEITTNSLQEPIPLNLAIHDDLEIVGDADGDGTPCTLVVPWGVNGRWSVPTGVYLQVASQHEWKISDLTIIPPHYGPGLTTGAVAMVIDTSSATRKHTELSLELERVTLTGSLAGSIPASPNLDQRSLSTRWGGGSGDESGVLVLRSVATSGDGLWQQVTLREITVSQGTTRGVALNAGATHVRFEGPSRITWNDGEGLAFTNGNDARLEIAGGDGNQRMIVAHNASHGVRIDAPGASASDVSLRGINILHNGSGSSEAGLFTESPLSSLSDAILAFNGRYNWYHRAAGSASVPLAVTAERVTLHDARYASGDTSPLCVSSLAKYNVVTLRDCMASGAPEAGFLEALYLSDSATGTSVILDHSALVTAGPHALSGNGIRNGAPGFTQIAVRNDDPQYLSLDPAQERFLNVSNETYFDAASNGEPLCGGARYLGAAVAIPYGSGCPGAGGHVPWIRPINGPPTPGNSSFQIWVMKTGPGATALLIAGYRKDFAPSLQLPLPLDLGFIGFTGCSLLTDFASFATPMATFGPPFPGQTSAYATVPIPWDIIGLLGGGTPSYHFQWVVLDPGAPVGLATSAGLTLTWNE